MARSTQLQIQERHDAILTFCEKQNPVSVRGIYYHLTTLGLVPKTQNGYQKVARDCKNLRIDGILPFRYIADSTRWMRKPKAFSSMQECLNNTARTYRRDLLTAQDLDIEIWLEKDALAGVFYPVTAKYDVPLMVSRGFASISFLHGAAQSLRENAYVYIFTDYDASGHTIDEKIREGLQEFSGKHINVKRAMLTAKQVETWNLPTRSPKASDRKAGFTFCAELDAIEPTRLRQEVESCITEHIYEDDLRLLRAIETEERASIRNIFSHSENL